MRIDNERLLKVLQNTSIRDPGQPWQT